MTEIQEAAKDSMKKVVFFVTKNEVYVAGVFEQLLLHGFISLILCIYYCCLRMCIGALVHFYFLPESKQSS